MRYLFFIYVHAKLYIYSINSMLARYAERQKYFQITNTETEVYLSVTYAQRPESWFRVMKMFSATVLTR